MFNRKCLKIIDRFLLQYTAGLMAELLIACQFDNDENLKSMIHFY